MTDSAVAPRSFDPVTLYKGLFLAVVVVFVATPLLATVLGGFKSLGELRTNPFGLPKVWELEHYASILFSRRYWQLLRNSAIVNFFDLCAISVPLPRDGRLPVGLTLIARNGHDRRLFRIAAGVEKLLAA